MCVRGERARAQNNEYLWCQLLYQFYEVDVGSKIAPLFRMKIMKTPERLSNMSESHTRKVVASGIEFTFLSTTIPSGLPQWLSSKG